MHKVTQADREAVALLFEALDGKVSVRAINVRLGHVDALDTVQAFAAHRLAERERCAGVAEAVPAFIDKWDGRASFRARIAAAIRSQDDA